MSVDSRKFDFSAAVMGPNQSSVPVPVCVSGPIMSDMLQPACDRVKFTTGHSMDFLMPDITSGGTVENNPLAQEVDLRVGRTDILLPKTEDWLSKNVDRKVESIETTMKVVKDEVMTSEPDADTKLLSSAAPVSVSQGDTMVAVSMELKPDLDKPSTSVDGVISNMTSSSSSAAVSAASSSTATTAGSEMMPLVSASDLKKEAQAISYDWVSCQCRHHIHIWAFIELVFNVQMSPNCTDGKAKILN